MKEICRQQNRLTLKLLAKFYIHRLWRITPTYMFVVMFSGCLTKYLGKGPNFEKNGFEPMCEVNWWTNLLYINNLVRTDKMVSFAFFSLKSVLNKEFGFDKVSRCIVVFIKRHAIPLRVAYNSYSICLREKIYSAFDWISFCVWPCSGDCFDH